MANPFDEKECSILTRIASARNSLKSYTGYAKESEEALKAAKETVLYKQKNHDSNTAQIVELETELAGCKEELKALLGLVTETKLHASKGRCKLPNDSLEDRVQQIEVES